MKDIICLNCDRFFKDEEDLDENGYCNECHDKIYSDGYEESESDINDN